MQVKPSRSTKPLATNQLCPRLIVPGVGMGGHFIHQKPWRESRAIRKWKGMDWTETLYFCFFPQILLLFALVSEFWRVAAASWKTFPFYRSFWLIVDKTKIAIQTNETVLVKASNCEDLSLFKQLPVYRQIQLDGNFRTYGIFKIAQFGNHCAKPIGLRLCLWWTETFT